MRGGAPGERPEHTYGAEAEGGRGSQNGPGEEKKQQGRNGQRRRGAGVAVGPAKDGAARIGGLARALTGQIVGEGDTLRPGGGTNDHIREAAGGDGLRDRDPCAQHTADSSNCPTTAKVASRERAFLSDGGKRKYGPSIEIRPRFLASLALIPYEAECRFAEGQLQARTGPEIAAEEIAR